MAVNAKIREYRPEDLDQVLALVKELESDVLPVAPGQVPPEFYLQITFVSKPFRNRGISKMLHKRIVEYAREQGHKELYACIAKWNEPEIAVIKSLKFEIKDLGYRYRLSLRL